MTHCGHWRAISSSKLDSQVPGNKGGAIYWVLFFVSWAFRCSSFSSAAFRGTSLTVSVSTLPEWRLVVLVRHARAGIHPDIEVLVDRLDERNGCDGQPAIVRSMTATLKSLPLGHWPLGMRAADGATHQSFCRSGIDVEDHHVGPWRVGHHKSGLQRSRYRAVVRGCLGEIPNLHSRGPEPDIKLARLAGR